MAASRLLLFGPLPSAWLAQLHVRPAPPPSPPTTTDTSATAAAAFAAAPPVQVRSRALDLPAGGASVTVLAPLIDLANHAPRPSCAVQLLPGAKGR